MEQLLKNYKKRLTGVQNTIAMNSRNGSISEHQRTARLYAKQECYNTIIAELENLIAKTDVTNEKPPIS